MQRYCSSLRGLGWEGENRFEPQERRKERLRICTLVLVTNVNKKVVEKTRQNFGVFLKIKEEHEHTQAGVVLSWLKNKKVEKRVWYSVTVKVIYCLSSAASSEDSG